VESFRIAKVRAEELKVAFVPGVMEERTSCIDDLQASPALQNDI
jgi:hypothetical protein